MLKFSLSVRKFTLRHRQQAYYIVNSIRREIIAPRNRRKYSCTSSYHWGDYEFD